MLIQRIIPCFFLLFMLPSLTQAKIVFRSKVDGILSLYVMDDDGSNVQRLTKYQASWPVWSPDGKQIAFARRPQGAPNWPERYAIYIINNDGTNLHRLTNEDTVEWMPSWSPDGLHIIFESNRSGTSQIWKMNLITKDMRQLTRTAGLTTEAAWSPDGKYIAYRDDPPRGYFTVYVMRANGVAHRALVPGDSFHLRYFPRWSSDSKSVVYIEKTLDQDSQVVTIKPVIHNIETEKRKIVDTPNNWYIHSACFTDNGKQLLVSAKHWNKDSLNAEKFDIYRYHLVTGKTVKLTNTPQDDIMMDWISDDVLSVDPQSKKKLTWSALKK